MPRKGPIFAKFRREPPGASCIFSLEGTLGGQVMTKRKALKICAAAFMFSAISAEHAVAAPACLVPQQVERWKADYERQMMVRDKSGSTYELHFRPGSS